MDKASKLYANALKEYNKANIRKALELCEKSISFNLRNPAALNLKGLLLYLNGDLEGAKAIWNLNKDYNKDKVSKKYLDNTVEDEKRKLMYDAAISLINDMKIKEAVILLRNCEESDFNSVNVGNAITVCLIRLGKYEEAEEYINKVLAIDKRNKEALENRKLLIEYGMIKKESRYNKLVLTISIIAVIIFLSYSGISKYIDRKKQNNFNNQLSFHNQKNIADDKKTVDMQEGKSKQEKANEGIDKESVVEKDASKEDVSNKNAYKEKIVKQEREYFPYENLKTAIEQKDYIIVYNIVVQWKDKNMEANEKDILAKGEWLIRGEGVEYFYGMARKKIEAQDYTNAVTDLMKSYSFGENSYIYQHAIYMLGFCYEKLGDIGNAAKYYEYYVSNYGSGDYTGEVLYNLAILYKDIDLGKSKSYANQIVSRFSGTMYNNTRIREILNK